MEPLRRICLGLLFFMTAASTATSAELTGKVTVDGRGVPNAIVYPLSGPDLDSIAMPPDLWQIRNRRLTPSIIVVQAGQALNVSNMDATGYNLMVRFQQGEFQNRLIKPGAQVAFKTTQPELFARASDDLNELHGYVCVLKHRVFTFTDNTGAFKFTNLPPGNYTFEAAHLQEGQAKSDIVIAAPGVTTDFTLPGRRGPNQPMGAAGFIILDREAPGEPLRIGKVFPESPAERAGIKPRSRLISVDGTNVVAMPFEEAFDLVRGPAGRTMTLELADENISRTNRIIVNRARVVKAGGVTRLVEE